MSDSPTPPENPFELENPTLGSANGSETNEEFLPAGAPNVAAKAGKTFLVLGVVGAAVLFLLYSIMFGGKKTEAPMPPKQVTVAPKPIEPPPLPVIEPPKITAPPVGIVAPSLPEPIDVPTLGNINVNPLTPKEDSAAKAQQLARLHSNIMVKEGNGGGGGLGSIIGGGSSSTPASQDPNDQFATGAANAKVETVAATRIKGNLRRTIAQGRIIQATLESALNTDLTAPIRAIVSRDTYGEAGNTPLIPKGSRLIGSYNTTLATGQTRVFVVWTRVIRPDGVDVMLGSPLVDGIGQAGVTGQIDSKFQEIFARSLMSSVMNIALAIGSDKISGGTTTTTNSAQGGSQTSGDAATTATTNALNRLGAVTDGFMQRFLNVKATILVDQGTPVNVFINKDIVFPDDAATGTRVMD